MPLLSTHLPVSVIRPPLFALEKGCQFYVSLPRLEKLRDQGPRWKFHDARLIQETLTNPIVVFEGLRRKRYREGLCYVGNPTIWFDNDGISENRDPRYVFLVFVTFYYGMLVFDWEWRRASATEPGHPNRWKRHFTRRVWHGPAGILGID